MKVELVNFINDLPEEVHTYNLSLDEGLYVFVDLDENGNLIGLEKDVYRKSKKKDDEMNPFLKKCLDIQINVQPVSPAKIFNPNKKIFNASCSPFALCFKKKILGKNVSSGINTTKEIEQYFKSASNYITTDIHKKWLAQFKKFCMDSLLTEITALEEYKDLKADSEVNIFLKAPNPKDYERVYEAYLISNVFNKDEYSEKVDDIIYGIADSLSSFSDKKMFWKHKTAPFEFNYRITQDEAKAIWQFFQLRKRILPNPLPIFIDKRELNGKVIAFLKEDNKLRFSEIIKKLFENPEHQKDLGNYYLLFFQKNELVDLDFVPSFKYALEDIKIEEVFSLGGRWAKRIENIFDFEDFVVAKIFDQVLVSKFDNSKSVRYFTDFNDKKNADVKFIKEFLTRQSKNFDSITIRVLKYRKAFYDYIYKSKHESIQDLMFHEIMLGGILDDIRLDEYKNKKHSNWHSIREKLNIWFSLYEYFKKDFKLQKEKTMASKILEHLEMMQNLISGKKTPKEDNEFAFATGQVLYYLFDKSESSDKSYSRLEPFLQKTNCLELQKTISNTFNAYKHKNFSNNFRKPFAEVMDYETNKNIKELMPSILAGFFSDNALFSTKGDDNNNVEEQILTT